MFYGVHGLLGIETTQSILIFLCWHETTLLLGKGVGRCRATLPFANAFSEREAAARLVLFPQGSGMVLAFVPLSRYKSLQRAGHKGHCLN